MIEADNHLVILVNSLSLATESKNLMAAKENMSHGQDLIMFNVDYDHVVRLY